MHNKSKLEHSGLENNCKLMFKYEKSWYLSRPVKRLQAKIVVTEPAMDSLDCSKKIRRKLLDFPYPCKKVCLADFSSRICGVKT